MLAYHIHSVPPSLLSRAFGVDSVHTEQTDMTASNPPVCENCKPGEATKERQEAVEGLDCQVNTCVSVLQTPLVCCGR